MASPARYGRGRREFLARTFQTALVLLRPIRGSDPTPRRKRSVSKNDHDHENPGSCWQRSLNGGHPPRLFSITVRGSAWGQTVVVCVKFSKSAMERGLTELRSKQHPFVRSKTTHPFVPTCRLAERRAQRQSRMPPLGRHRR